MKRLMMGAAVLALLGPSAYAQTGMAVPTTADSGQVSPGEYLVFFDLNSAALNEAGREVVSQAAASYRASGTAQVSVTGYTDLSGSPSYNQRLSERRADAVEVELVRQGVPASSITTIARGQDDPLVPTADGVREARNRRVAIVIPPPPAPPPTPVAEAAPPPPEEPPPPDRFNFSLGPVYGHNFGESDGDGGDKTQSDLVGAELTFHAFPGFLGGVSLKQMALWSINSLDDGLAGRSVVSLDFAPDLGIFRPALSANFGGIYGNGVQTGFVAGPEISFDVNIIEGMTFGLKAAYDYQLRNAGWDEGIVWGGLDLGIRF
jgi:hypothetical protein